MPDIFIPENVITGFNKIAKLSTHDVEQIADYLKTIIFSSNASKILTKFEDFVSTELNIKDARDIIEAILSFSNLEIDKDSEDLSSKLAESFKELYSPDIRTEDFNSLKSNILVLLNNSENIRMSLKASRLTADNSNVYYKSKISSDIRLIFNEDLNSKDRRAVLLHNLHISYRSNKKTENFFVTLDLDDLKELKETIERAIKKEEIIKKDYQQFQII